MDGTYSQSHRRQKKSYLLVMMLLKMDMVGWSVMTRTLPMKWLVSDDGDYQNWRKDKGIMHFPDAGAGLESFSSCSRPFRCHLHVHDVQQVQEERFVMDTWIQVSIDIIQDVQERFQEVISWTLTSNCPPCVLETKKFAERSCWEHSRSLIFSD